jgi:hypothetical protein
MRIGQGRRDRLTERYIEKRLLKYHGSLANVTTYGSVTRCEDVWNETVFEDRGHSAQPISLTQMHIDDQKVRLEELSCGNGVGFGCLDRTDIIAHFFQKFGKKNGNERFVFHKKNTGSFHRAGHGSGLRIAKMAWNKIASPSFMFHLMSCLPTATGPENTQGS